MVESLGRVGLDLGDAGPHLPARHRPKSGPPKGHSDGAPWRVEKRPLGDLDNPRLPPLPADSSGPREDSHEGAKAADDPGLGARGLPVYLEESGHPRPFQVCREPSVHFGRAQEQKHRR